MIEPHSTEIFGEFPNGIQRIYKFKNGYGASVVMHNGSYGGNKGLWELAVLNEEGDLCYHTPITQDVIGYLTDTSLQSILEEIKAL